MKNNKEKEKISNLTKAILIKNALGWVFGRNKVSSRLLYSIFSRIVLLFQKPIAIIIYKDLNLIKEDRVFQSLDTEKEFGDQELATVFEKKLVLFKDEEIKKCAFNFFNTGYYIVFFIIKYDAIGCNIENAKFELVTRGDKDSIEDDRFNSNYGFMLLKILENDDNLAINNFIANEINAIDELNGRFFKEFNNFPWSLSYKEKEFELDELKFLESNEKDKKEIDNIIDIIRNELIQKIHESITTAPLINNNNIEFNNFFVFLKTATLNRKIKGQDGNFYKFPYTLRLMLCDKQRKKIIEHYKAINSGKSCSWYNQENGECRMQARGENIGLCMFSDHNKDNPPIEVEEFIKNIESPFVEERSFLETPLASGILGVADVYPDFSRGRTIGEPFSLWKKENIAVSPCQACLLCLAYQTVSFKEKVSPKAIVSPVTVNGVTSMAIVTMSAENTGDESKEWMLIYSRYLAVISRLITQRVRVKEKELLLKSIERAFSDNYIKCFNVDKKEFYPVIFVEYLNEEIKKLAHIYPLQIVEFSLEDFNLEESNKDNIRLFKKGNNTLLYFSLRENKYFSRLHKFDYLKLGQVKYHLEKGRGDAGEKLYLSIQNTNNVWNRIKRWFL